MGETTDGGGGGCWGAHITAIELPDDQFANRANHIEDIISRQKSTAGSSVHRHENDVIAIK
jgi:hypothetical protein